MRTILSFIVHLVLLGSSSCDSFLFSHWGKFVRRRTFSTSSYPLDHVHRSLPPSKGDFYSDAELRKILDLHGELERSGLLDKPSTGQEKGNVDKDDTLLSLHDLVLETLENTAEETSPSEIPGETKYKLTQELKQKILNIKAIVSDVDGTLVKDGKIMHPRTKDAIETAVKASRSPVKFLQHFILATGKSKTGAMQSLGFGVSALLSELPGVYNQGLLCLDRDDSIIWENRLIPEQIAIIQEFAEKRNLSLFLYDGDQIYANEIASEEYMTEFHDKWGEPLPIKTSAESIVEKSFHKALIMDHDTNLIGRLRPDLETLADSHNLEVTQAIETMLEVLPYRTSKAEGVKQLCMHLGIDPSKELLAIGDGENDIEMLQMSAVGIAMGNAVDKLKRVADVVVAPVDQGGAGEAIELFGLGAVLK